MVASPGNSSVLVRILSVRMARRITIVGVVVLMWAAIGFATDPIFGGLGVSMFYVGIVVAPALFACAWFFGDLIERRPHLSGPLEEVWSSGLQALGVVAVAVVILEIRTRSTHPLRTVEYESKDQLIHLQRPHHVLGWVGAKNYTVDVDFLGGTRPFRTNSRGFRDIEQEPDPKRRRVVIIGDSFPLSWGNDREDGIAPLLRESLPDAQIFNASWQGWSIDQIAWSYTELARPLEPDVVLMMFIVAPGLDTSYPLYLGARKPYYVVREGRLVLGGVPVEFQASAAENERYYNEWQAARIDGPWRAARYLLYDFPRSYSVLAQRLLPEYDWPAVARHGLPPPDPVNTLVLQQLAADIAKDGAKLIVVPSPRQMVFTRLADPAIAMSRHLDGYRRLGIETVDITPLLKKDAPTCFNLEDHLNAAGNRRIRAAIADRVRAALQREP